MNVRRLNEALAAVVLFALAASWGAVYWNRSFQSGRQPAFYQAYFEPALMVACGRGFVIADPPVPAVIDFLRLKRDALSCGDIPRAISLTDRGLYQKSWLYLMLTVACAWRVLGISWSGLGPLFGLFFGGTILAAYGIFRLGMSRAVSLCCAAALAVSAVHLQNLPHLRDYAKAPFTLALFFLIGASVSGPVTWRRLLAIAAAYGAVLGIGYGFRSDFLIDIPLFVIVIFAFLRGGLHRNLAMKIAAVGVCAAAFAATVWPVVTAGQGGGGNEWHAILLGLTDGPTDALMVAPAPYSFGHDFSDGFVYSAATAYGRRTMSGIGHVEYASHTYDLVTRRYAVDIARTFPGDMITRALASVVQVLQLPFRWFDLPLPGLWSGFYRLRLFALKPLRGSGVVFVALTLLALTSADLRLGLFGIFFLCYVGGYPMLQFDVRHYFHLEFMTWWAMGFLAHQLWVHWRATADGRLKTMTARIRAQYDWRRGGRTLAAIAGGVVVALWLSRGYQQVSATRLFQQYVDAPKQAIDMGTRSTGVLHRVALGHDIRWDDPYPAELLEVDLDVARCGVEPEVAFLYDRPFDAFSHTVLLTDRSPAAEPTRVFEPVYAGFSGLRFRGTTPQCVNGVYRAAAPDGLRLMLSAELPPSWRRHAMFQQLIPLRWHR